MKYVYLGTAASDIDLSECYEKYSNTKIVYVQQKWDYVFYKALEEICGDDISCISYPPVQTYPVGRKVFVRGKRITGVKKGYYISVINLPIIKQACSICSVLHGLNRIGKDNNVMIITHTLYFQSILASRMFKRFHKNTRIISMVPDLPDYATDDKISKSGIMRVLFFLYKKISLKAKNSVDGYVCFSEKQMEKLDNNKPFIVMEGYSTENELEPSLNIDNETGVKYFFYAGNLKDDSGVLEFAKAFVLADVPNTQLWICGDGSQKRDIEALNSPSIKLLGILPRGEVVKLEKEAYALVNPRPVDKDYAKYSFPSKLLEYMISGTPVLTTHLLCIPSDYDEYLYYLDDPTIEGMCATLKVLVVDRAIGSRARDFVKKEKNPTAQARKVIEYVNSFKQDN